MTDVSSGHTQILGEYPSGNRAPSMPWQLWVVTVLLAIEGILGNLPAIPSNPIAAFWFAFKCLFITGFFLRWRPVYVLSLIIGALHALAFSATSPFVALINLVLVVLVASTKSYFFFAR